MATSFPYPSQDISDPLADEPVAGGADLRGDLLRFRDRAIMMRWWILGIIATMMVLGVVVTLLVQPLYRAMALIEISTVEEQVTSGQPLETQSRASDQQYYETQ